MLRNGVDIIEIERIKIAVERHGKQFLERIYTPLEITECQHQISSFAVRFAAKEAVAKTLGTGIGEISWKEIEICRADSGAPILKLYGRAANLAESQGLNSWAISLSHTKKDALASVVASG